MKKQLFFLLFIVISFLSCGGADKGKSTSISNIDTDFPVSEELEFKVFNKYEIFGEGTYMVDDSVLWHFERSEHNLGFCYDLNTGEKLSMIASIGKAAYELTGLEGLQMTKDSVCIRSYGNIIKTFGKKDIIDNVPLGDRKFSVSKVPDSINAKCLTKLPNGSVLTTIGSTFYTYHLQQYEINKKTVALIKDNEVKAYETINYDSFDVGTAGAEEIGENELVKNSYSDGGIEVKGVDTAVFYSGEQFMFYTFDINSGNVVDEKRYTEMKRGEGEGLTIAINDLGLKIHSMKVTDEYIVCRVDGYFNKEDKELKRQKKAIFIFDWNLKPIKRFSLPEKWKYYYSISNDCKSIFVGEYTEEGLTLYKADLKY